jgi:5-methylcytosine-specific restriction enzyme A
MALKDHYRFSKAVTRTRRWAILRAAVLERDGFKCVQCSERRRLEIDHIKPVRTHPDLAFDPANCQALCAACHSRKTRLEVGHKPTPKDRLQWRESVKALEHGEEKPKHKGDTQCLIQ